MSAKIYLYEDPKSIGTNCVVASGSMSRKAFTDADKAKADAKGYVRQSVQLKVIGAEAEAFLLSAKKGMLVEFPPIAEAPIVKSFQRKDGTTDFEIQFTSFECPGNYGSAGSAKTQEPIMSQEQYAEASKAFFGGKKK